MLCNETSGWQLWQHDPNRLIEGVEMPQQVRGVIAKAKGEPVSIETIVIPDPGPGEVVVAIAACGVCHTDLHCPRRHQQTSSRSSWATRPRARSSRWGTA